MQGKVAAAAAKSLQSHPTLCNPSGAPGAPRMQWKENRPVSLPQNTTDIYKYSMLDDFLFIFKTYLNCYIALYTVKLNLFQLLKDSKNDDSVILETKRNFK